MGKRERDRGARGERMLRDLLRARGWPAERGQQRAGGGDSPDVKGGPPGFHFEVKFTERFQALAAYRQALEDASTAQPPNRPVVAWKRARGPWMALLSLDDLLDLIDAYILQQLIES